MSATATTDKPRENERERDSAKNPSFSDRRNSYETKGLNNH